MFHQLSFILLILLYYYVQYISCEFSLDRITKCYTLNENNLRYKDKTKVISNKVFFLFYADNGIEAFNVIDSYDIQRLKLLVQCIEAEDKSYFEDRLASNSISFL